MCGHTMVTPSLIQAQYPHALSNRDIPLNLLKRNASSALPW
jgi:hypothetical protein